MSAEPDVLTRAFRPSCSSCGWVSIEWLTPAEARTKPELASLLVEVEGVVGPVERVWRCPACHECGFFGETVSEFG